MRVIFLQPWKWSDGKQIRHFDAGACTVPDECGALAIERGVAEPGKKPKPKKEVKLND